MLSTNKEKNGPIFLADGLWSMAVGRIGRRRLKTIEMDVEEMHFYLDGYRWG